MIQFNLLPDVKKDYVKAKRAKKVIISGALFASGASIAIVLILFSIVQIAQKRHINGLTTDIKKSESEIKNISDINRLLTVQNQLSLLTGLHEKKPETSRVFDYLKFVSPAKLSVGNLKVTTTDSVITLQGTADSIATVNTFVDNLKSTKYAVVGDTAANKLPAFSKINTQLSGNNEEANFNITLSSIR
jgi:Tfp pilus assembly protein PilN